MEKNKWLAPIHQQLFDRGNIMKKSILLSSSIFLLYFLHHVVAQSVYGADVSTLVSEQSWACLKAEHGVQFASVRAWKSSGVFDATAPATVGESF